MGALGAYLLVCLSHRQLYIGEAMSAAPSCDAQKEASPVKKAGHDSAIVSPPLVPIVYLKGSKQKAPQKTGTDAAAASGGVPSTAVSKAGSVSLPAAAAGAVPGTPVAVLLSPVTSPPLHLPSEKCTRDRREAAASRSGGRTRGKEALVLLLLLLAEHIAG